MDLVINNVNEPALVYKNLAIDKKVGHYISFKLEGIGQNKFAIGAKVLAYIGDKVITRELMPSRGFQSSVDYKIMMGLGAHTKLDSVIINWPNNTRQKISQLLIIDTTNAIKQPEPGDKSLFEYANKHISQKPLLTKTVVKFDKHKQPDYTDFYAEEEFLKCYLIWDPRQQ